MVGYNTSSFTSSRHLRASDQTSPSILPTLPSISSTGSITSTYRSNYRANPRSSIGSHASSRIVSTSTSTRHQSTESIHRTSSLPTSNSTKHHSPNIRQHQSPNVIKHHSPKTSEHHSPKANATKHHSPNTTKHHSPDATKHHSPNATKHHSPNTTKHHSPNATKHHSPKATKNHSPNATKDHSPNKSKHNSPNTAEYHPLDTTKHHSPNKTEHQPQDATKHHSPNTTEHHPLDATKHHSPNTTEHHPLDATKHHSPNTTEHHPLDATKHHSPCNSSRRSHSEAKNPNICKLISGSKELQSGNELFGSSNLHKSGSSYRNGSTLTSRHYGSYSGSGQSSLNSSSGVTSTRAGGSISSASSKINHTEMEKIANKYRRSVSIDSIGSSGRESDAVSDATKTTTVDTSSRLSIATGSGLVGLKNLGNTCFMNSIIQCLSHSRPVREYFLSHKYKTELSCSSKMQGRLAEEFASLLADMWSGRSDTVSPNKFKSAVAKSAPRFVGYSQQDSHEFLRFFMEGLHEDLNKGKKGKRTMEEPPAGLTDGELADHRWNGYTLYDSSSIVDTFVGLLKSTLTCSVCDHKSVTFDPFWDLSLPLPRSRGSRLNLQSCFTEFTQEEILDGDEKPTCESCKKRQKCTKQFSIERFPPILVLHLKRFSEVRYRTKLSTKVDFPVENLDLSDFSSHTRGHAPQYDLVGVSNHSGNTFSGHYIAYCQVGARWHRFSDSSVSGLSRADIVSSEAYVLFYERKR